MSSLKDNKEIILKQIEKDPFNLQFAGEKLKNDKDIVLSAMEKTNDPKLLQYAGKQIKDDKEFMLIAVSKSGWNLRNASDSLKNDLDVVYQALIQQKFSYIFIGEELTQKIGGQDPITYIEIALHKQQLEKELAPKTEKKQTQHIFKI